MLYICGVYLMAAKKQRGRKPERKDLGIAIVPKVPGDPLPSGRHLLLAPSRASNASQCVLVDEPTEDVKALTIQSLL